MDYRGTEDQVFSPGVTGFIYTLENWGQFITYFNI